MQEKQNITIQQSVDFISDRNAYVDCFTNLGYDEKQVDWLFDAFNKVIKYAEDFYQCGHDVMEGVFGNPFRLSKGIFELIDNDIDMKTAVNMTLCSRIMPLNRELAIKIYNDVIINLPDIANKLDENTKTPINKFIEESQDKDELVAGDEVIKKDFIIRNGKLIKYIGNDKEVVIPDCVTSIDSYAFYKCTSITNITIPDSVTSIGNNAFNKCTSLTNITIPNSVTSIGWWAFESCTSLTNITIPDSVTTIAYDAFKNCSSLASITIPESVTKIGNYAFNKCYSLTTVIMSDNVTEIGEGAFINCTSLTTVVMSDNVTKIGEGTFVNCKSLTSITIPNSVTWIGEKAFMGCESLKSITFEGNIELAKDVFDCCNNLEEIIVRNEEMKQYLIENVDLPEGCEIKVIEKELNKAPAISKLIDTNNTKEFTAGDEVLNNQEQLSVPVTPSGEDISHDDDNHDEL